MPEPSPVPAKILLVEGPPEHVLLLDRALSAEYGPARFAIEHAATLEAALDRIARGGIDAAVVDLVLPDGADLEAIRAAAPELPILVLTPTDDDHAAFRALRAGAQDYLPKSVLDGPGLLLAHPLGMAIERVRLEAALDDARHAAERSGSGLERKRGLSAAILDAEDAVVLVVDPLGRVIRHNRKAEEVLGLAGRVPRVAHISDVLHPLNASGSLDDLLDALPPDGHGGVVETTFPDGSGESRTLMWHASTMPLVGGSSRYVVLVGTDTTEHRRLEARLQERQKLEALGELTGGVAHDFNNLVNVIAVNAEMLAQDLADSDEGQREALSEVLAAAGRARNLVSRLMTFARRGSAERETVDLASFLRDLHGTLRRVFPETIRLDLDLGSEALPTLMADPVALHQAIVNLANNARDAAGGTGTIRVTVERVSVESDEAAVYPWVNPGPFLRIRVHDDGEGMDETTRARAIEPFFTTKPVGKGTGLGLPMVYATARQHRGFVTIESAPGVGTTVDLHLPVGADLDIEAAPEGPEAGAVRGGFETILLVEDEVALRRTATKVLERFGYRVVTAVDGNEALTVWGRHRDRIELVISDAVMPRMGGRELLGELRKLGCAVPFILTSGYGDRLPATRASRLFRAAMVLPKPWSVEALARAVRTTLDQAS